ncbi:hypothetical protein AX16_003393 [Volvariella volvacea WC 439]|nr:hypothetical protein AX16_003393 [Volvariella volvacea WC 439]
MSRRSAYDSYSQEKRVSKYRVTDDDVYNYALRAGILSYLMRPKPTPDPSGYGRTSSGDPSKDHISRLSALSTFSITDMFREIRDGKTVKFPEKLLKVLDQKLEVIAMGKDPAYSDQLVRRTMAKFYGQFKDESWKRQMKENRKIEELILMFATHSTPILKKEPSLQGDAWKFELNRHIGLFVRILRDCLRGMHHVSPELLTRLDGYAEKLAPATTMSPSTWSDSGYESSSSSNYRDSYTGGLGSPNSGGGSVSVSEMQLVGTVAALFKIPEHTVQQQVDQMKGSVVTERAAFVDLKTCLKNINAGAPFPGRSEDFDSEAAWQHWKHQETTTLGQLVMIMVKLNPELAKSSSGGDVSYGTSNTRPGSVYSSYDSGSEAGLGSRPLSIASRRSYYDGGGNGYGDPLDDDDDGIQVGHNFTFIPPNPKRFYKRLLERCLAFDLEKMLSPEVDDSEEVSLGILSQPNIDLLNECALRWRIGHSYRVTCFLELVKGLYERGEVPIEVIPEALGNVQKVVGELDFENWAREDADYLASTYASLFQIFLSSLYHAMDSLPTNLKPATLEPYLNILQHVLETGLLDRFEVDVPARMADVQNKVREVAKEWYDVKMAELQKAPGVNKALPLLLMTDEIEKAAKLLDKRFPEPLLGQIDLVSLVVEVVIPVYLEELSAAQRKLYEASMNTATPTPDIPIQDIFALYRRTKTLTKMYSAFCQKGTLEFDLSAFFEPYVRQWMVNTDSTTGQWVDNAIAADKFEAEGAEGHSSSIVDLFDSLKSPIQFLEDLEWQDEYQNARFFTNLSRTIANAIQQYCRSVETLFLTEMYPRPTDYLQPQKSSAWLEKARQAVSSSSTKVEPFNFQPASCVKLNNVEAARRLLDGLYNQMQVDKVAAILERSAPPVPEKNGKGSTEKFLFTVKICIAEGLVPLDSSPSSMLDTFVTLSDEQGNRLAKTRTIYESLSPRWDETFDISVEKPLWLMVSIRDRALVGKHDNVGRAYLCLDPRRFGDFLAHELWMDLDTQGRVLVRISMEGEKDDIQFYFGRAFRSLKRAEGDMLRIFIDKMSPFIKQCLSRPVLKTLLQSRSGLDYNKAFGGVTAFYRNAIGTSNSEVQIPLPNGEKPRTRPDELTDVEIEQAILPLFDYFDANLQTLNTYLSDTAKEMVMTRVWKDILMTIEGLLIPPLSEIESDMEPLSDKEVDIVFKWLKFLRDYFYAGGEGPVPLEVLQNQKYRDVLSIRLYYDWHTDALMEECIRMMQQSLQSAPTMKKRAKSVYNQRNLGTIRERKKEKQQEKEIPNGETILRILRMRPGTSEFIAQQLQIMSTMQAEQEQRAREQERRKAQRAANAGSISRANSEIPPVPPLPGNIPT